MTVCLLLAWEGERVSLVNRRRRPRVAFTDAIAILVREDTILTVVENGKEKPNLFEAALHTASKFGFG